MGEALRLLVGGSAHLYAALFGALCAGLQVLIPYRRYVHFLKWLTLALLACVATVFVVDVARGDVLRSTFLPKLEWSKGYITVIVTVFGTTISPYLFLAVAVAAMFVSLRH